MLTSSIITSSRFRNRCCKAESRAPVKGWNFDFPLFSTFNWNAWCTVQPPTLNAAIPVGAAINTPPVGHGRVAARVACHSRTNVVIVCSTKVLPAPPGPVRNTRGGFGAVGGGGNGVARVGKRLLASTCA